MAEIIEGFTPEPKFTHRYDSALVNLVASHALEKPEDYPFSTIVRIMHRTAKGNFNRKFNIPRGQISRDDLLTTRGLVERLVLIKDGNKTPYVFELTNGKYRLKYVGYIFPGLKFGYPIYQLMDKKMQELALRRLSNDDKFDVIALESIVIGATHIFPDGNGRADRGTVAVEAKRLLGKNINQDTFLAKRRQYAFLKHMVSVCLLPQAFNPKTIFRQMAREGIVEKEVVFPDDSEEVTRFLKDYRESILQFINNFTLPISNANGSLSIEFSLKRIANFYSSLSKL